jgi:hypothetical protein
MLSDHGDFYNDLLQLLDFCVYTQHTTSVWWIPGACQLKSFDAVLAIFWSLEKVFSRVPMAPTRRRNGSSQGR